MIPSDRVRPTSVLLVEDNAGDARLIVELLHDVAGGEFELERVDRLGLALARLSTEPVDIVLLDLDLPDSQGMSTFESTRRAIPHEPIIVISGLDDETVALQAVRSGAQDYLVKGNIEGHLLARVIRYAIERKRAERELLATQERYRALVEHSRDGVSVFGADGTVLYSSPAAQALLGYAADELLGHSSFELILPEDRDNFARLLRESLRRPREQVPVRTHVRHKDGSWRLIEATFTNLLDEPSVGGIVNNYRDVTERTRVDEELRETSERFRKLAEASFDAITITQAGIIKEVNRGFLETFGFAHEADVVGTPVIDLVDPRSVHAVIENMQSNFEGTYELVCRRTDGRKIVLEATARAHTIDGQPARITALRDVTEKRALEEQFRQAQKMEAIGRLAGGVAHDFNNLLTVITGNAELMMAELVEGDPRAEDLKEIRHAASAGAILTRQLLTFSRQQVIEPRTIPLNEVVAQTKKMLSTLIGEDIEVTTSFTTEPCVTLIDPAQLEQVIMNLAINARDAMPTGGRLTIETAVVELDEHEALTHGPVTPGRYAMLAVSDTGTGMDLVTQRRIFEPFFTTKEPGKGTGLGLATVYGIVKQCGGNISCYSELGIGTTFKIYLPLVEEPAMKESHDGDVRVAPRGSETVLLVEDSLAVREIARRVLMSSGYTVIACESAIDALVQAATPGRPVHLLLTDVVMPQMSGRVLAERFAELHPTARVLFMSGYTDDAIVRHGVLGAGMRYLQKPFTPASLGSKVREVLDSA